MPTVTRKLIQAYNQRVNDNVSEIINEKSPDLCDKLEHYLATHWQSIKNSPLAYTAIPDAQATLKLIEIANYVSIHKYHGKVCPIKLLMPTVYLYSIDNRFKNLDQLDLHWVLKNYIIGREGLYLIPVRQLPSLMELPTNKWFNAYFDAIEQGESAHTKEMLVLSPEEFSRLTQHSVVNENLYNTYNYFQAITQSQGSFLVHVKQFANALEINSTDREEIAENNAGTGAYNAIILFNDYYQNLSQENKTLIPSALKQELEYILEIAKDKDANKKAQEDLNTCIARRKSSLLQQINFHESQLAVIGVKSSPEKDLISAVSIQLADYKEDFLVQTRENGPYHGHDRLPLTRDILKDQGLEFEIETKEDMNSFMRLYPGEIENLIQDDKIKTQIISYFENLELFMVFASQTNPVKFGLIMKYLGANLGPKIIESNASILNLISILTMEQTHLACRYFNKSFQTVLTNYIDLGCIMEHLNLAQCHALCTSLSAHIPTIISKESELKKLVKNIGEEKTKLISNSLNLKTENTQPPFFSKKAPPTTPESPDLSANP